MLQGVTYEQLPVQISPEFRELYNKSCAVWMEVTVPFVISHCLSQADMPRDIIATFILSFFSHQIWCWVCRSIIPLTAMQRTGRRGCPRCGAVICASFASW